MSDPRVIKKYPNRRLYDTVESRYITLADVRRLVVEKIDFVNLATVDRAVAAGLLQLADEPDAPAWSGAKGAAIYKEAER